MRLCSHTTHKLIPELAGALRPSSRRRRRRRRRNRSTYQSPLTASFCFFWHLAGALLAHARGCHDGTDETHGQAMKQIDVSPYAYNIKRISTEGHDKSSESRPATLSTTITHCKSGCDGESAAHSPTDANQQQRRQQQEQRAPPSIHPPARARAYPQADAERSTTTNHAHGFEVSSKQPPMHACKQSGAGKPKTEGPMLCRMARG